MENSKDGVILNNSNDSPSPNQGKNDIAAVSSSSELSLDCEVAEKIVVNLEDDLVIVMEVGVKEVDVKDDLVVVKEVDVKEDDLVVVKEVDVKEDDLVIVKEVDGKEDDLVIVKEVDGKEDDLVVVKEVDVKEDDLVIVKEVDVKEDDLVIVKEVDVKEDDLVIVKEVDMKEDDLVIVKEVDVKEDDLVIMKEVDIKEEGKIVIDSNEAKDFEIEEARDGNEKVTAVSRSFELHLKSDIAKKSAEDWDLVYTKDVDVDKEARDVATEVKIESFDLVETKSIKDRDLEERNIQCVHNLDKDSEKEADVFDERIRDEIGEEISLDANVSLSSDEGNESMEIPDDNENSIDENNEKSREVDEISIPYFSLPRPLEYGEFKLTVEKNLKIGMEKSPEQKKVTQRIDEKKDCPKKIDKEDDIVFLGFYEAPSNMLPGPSRSSDTSTHSGQSSAMGPDGRMLNYEISPRIISPAQAPARYHAPSHQRELCFEITGGKREMLKKRLLQKMKVARAQKFIRQREMEDIDNEEEEVKYSKDEEEECNWDEEFKEGESCNQAREMNLECRYAPYDEIKEHFRTSYCVTAPDFERTDTGSGSPVLFSSLPSYQPGGGFENPDKRKDSTEEEIDVADINSDAESCEEVDVEAISSSNSVDSFQEKQDVTIPHKSCWGSPIPFNEDSVEEICSGAFPSTFNPEHGPEDSVSSSKSAPEEIESCMWVYRDNKEVISDKSSPSIKEILSSSSEPKTSAESDQLMGEETVSRQKKRCISSEEDDGNEASSLESGEIRDDSPTSSPVPFITKSKNRKYLSDSEDSADEVMDEEDPQDNAKEIEMKRLVYKDFVDDEAELSGEELSSDENEDALSVAEEMEEEEVEIPESEVIEMGKIHLKRINADDDQLLKKIKNDFLDEGELHNEDGERSRKFKWNAPSTSQDITIVNSSDSEDDNKVNVDHEKLKWLKESANASEDVPDEQPPSEKKIKMNILSKNNISVNEIKAEKRSKVKRGSFLKKDEDIKNFPKDSAKKTSTTKGTLFGSRQNKPPEADEF